MAEKPKAYDHAGRALGAQGLLLVGVLTLGSALSGCVGYEGDFDRGYQIDEETLSQVKVGSTTKPQALALLGTPSTTSTVGGDAWYYVSQRTERDLAFMPAKITDQHVVAVYFDKEKKVKRIADYGLEDGKPIDFVTRQTPTAGAESNLVRSMMGAMSNISSLSPF